jgi:hypothetical protein
LTKRELQKQLYRSWRQLGRNIPRGFVFPSARDVTRKLDFIYDFAQALITDKVDQEALDDGEFDAVTRGLLEKHGVPHNR